MSIYNPRTELWEDRSLRGARVVSGGGNSSVLMGNSRGNFSQMLVFQEGTYLREIVVLAAAHGTPDRSATNHVSLGR